VTSETAGGAAGHPWVAAGHPGGAGRHPGVAAGHLGVAGRRRVRRRLHPPTPL